MDTWDGGVLERIQLRCLSDAGLNSVRGCFLNPTSTGRKAATLYRDTSTRVIEMIQQLLQKSHRDAFSDCIEIDR
jgi:hypothetical protein